MDSLNEEMRLMGKIKKASYALFMKETDETRKDLEESKDAKDKFKEITSLMRDYRDPFEERDDI